MAYSICLEKAAQRHFDAGEHLFQHTHRKDVAGYLFGLSAECAIKEIISKLGMRLPLDRRSDPVFAHFPHLKRLLRNHVKGRNGQVLTQFITDRYMQEWDIVMRYAPPQEIPQERVALWREHAREAVKAMYGLSGRR